MFDHINHVAGLVKVSVFQVEKLIWFHHNFLNFQMSDIPFVLLQACVCSSDVVSCCNFKKLTFLLSFTCGRIRQQYFLLPCLMIIMSLSNTESKAFRQHDDSFAQDGENFRNRKCYEWDMMNKLVGKCLVRSFICWNATVWC